MQVREMFYHYLAQTSPKPLALEVERAEGVFLYDTSGKAYFDLISGISVSNTGHRHPEVLKAINKQLDKYLHLMVYGEYVQQPQAELARRLCQLLPDPLGSVYFVNSGSEAIEGALKLAKRFTGRSGIVSFKNAYHGSTHGALSIMGCEEMKQAFRPLLPDISIVPFNSMDSLRFITSETAAVVIEMVQGEAGVRIPDVEFIRALSARCRETGSLLIADEIQTGLGRTGKLFCFEHYGIVPDIITLAKGLGGGLPLGAFIASPEVMKTLSVNPVLGHITTFGGHPLSCAAALANLELIVNEKLAEKVDHKASLFYDAIALHPRVKEFRNKGLLMAFELHRADQILLFIDHCLSNGVIVDWFLFSPESVRLAPPLTITEEEIHQACALIIKSLEECDNG